MADSFGWDYIDLASIPALQSGEIHIYATTLEPDDSWTESALRLLDPPERQRASRFRFEVDRFRFEKTRTLLRLLLSDYLCSPPEAIEFREGPHGKPYLSALGSDLQFNVSHTKGAAVLAFARGFEVGIDIEHAQRKVDVEGVGKRVFTEWERASIARRRGPSSLRQFFRFWTAKEAYLKATGSGLSSDPAKIEANFNEGRFTAAGNPGEVLPYALREIPTGNQFLVSMAHETCSPQELRLKQIV